MLSKIFLNEILLRDSLDESKKRICVQYFFNMFLERVEFDYVRIDLFLVPLANSYANNAKPPQVVVDNLSSIMQYAKMINVGNYDEILEKAINHWPKYSTLVKLSAEYKAAYEKTLNTLKEFSGKLSAIRKESMSRLGKTYQDPKLIKTISDIECMDLFIPLYSEMMTVLNDGTHREVCIPRKFIMTAFTQKFIDYFKKE